MHLLILEEVLGTQRIMQIYCSVVLQIMNQVLVEETDTWVINDKSCGVFHRSTAFGTVMKVLVLSRGRSYGWMSRNLMG